MSDDVIEFEGPFLRLRKKKGWQYVERPGITGIIAVIPVTDDNELILVEQFRIPVEAVVIELPAGLVGDDGPADEELVEAAKRELLEETGYEADCWELAYQGPPSPGLSNEIVSFFMATGLKKVGVGGGVGNEDIKVKKVPISEVWGWINSRCKQGAMVDPKLFGGLFYIQERLNSLQA